MTAQTQHSAFADFKQVVNMSVNALAAWLKTDESKAVGFSASEGGQSIGHRSGKKTIALLGKTQAEFTSSDIAYAPKVVGYFNFTWRKDQRVMSTEPIGGIR